MLRYFFLLFFVSLVGCSAPGIEITDNNNHIKTPYYSITVPANSGWQQHNGGWSPDLLTVSKTISNNFYLMRFRTNWIEDEDRQSWTAERLADAYRADERADMIKKAVMRGQFKINSAVIGEERIGYNKFYTMNQIITSKGIKQNSFLYLCFPKANGFSRFFIAYYIEEIDAAKSFKHEFLKTLYTLKMGNQH
ncbi:hypothetical protein [Desulfotalea psychrophila]|uniref:Lipoprotein n=1 Tax=Desulfotalea psychrophila (strain LSv54 / DSM 12343) TaxID=177439 RepID=Q6ARR4_DESPS|nr:hypothetical protein [Desulfotalea psychrophila]CAG34961.1 unknown protein [Desulfotalea psychrophila LSv54]